MAYFNTEIFDVNGVLNFFDRRDSPMWRIYAGNRVDNKMCREEYLGTNMTESRQALQGALEAIASMQHNKNQYLLQVISSAKPGKTGNVVPVEFVQVVFQFNGAVPAYQGAVGSVGSSPQMERLIESNMQLSAAVGKILEGGADEVDEEPKGFLGKLMDNPQLEGMVINGLSKLLGLGDAPAARPGASIAGINEDDDHRISVAIDILKKYDAKLADHLMYLADMAENDNAQFNMVVGMLK